MVDDAVDSAPTFSIVSAVYNVARYLDDFIGSIEAQSYPHDRIHVVVVDDGSTDDSLAILEKWQSTSDLRVTVVSKENGGQGSARNAGLEHVGCDWVTFTDPDDRIAEDYFERVAAFVVANPETDMVATNRIYLDDIDGELRNTHPLRTMFRDGDVVRRLSARGRFFAGHVPSVLFRSAKVAELGLRFDDRIRPNFEDGHFCCRYLLAAEDPAVGFVKSAVYHYRRRSDGTSTLQSSQRDPRRYTDVLRYGYLDVLQAGVDRYGTAPSWLQNYIVYELSWYISNAENGRGQAPEGAISDQFHRLMQEILGYLSPAIIGSFSLRAVKPAWRQILLHGYEEEPWTQGYAVVTGHDRDKNMVRLSYFYTGNPPHERAEVRGRWLRTPYAKVRDYVVNHRVLMRERILWLPMRGSIHLQLDGVDVPLHVREPEFGRRTLLPGSVKKVWDLENLPPRERTEAEGRILKLAASRPVRRLFQDAWVLMDRIHEADDSAEHLFRHLRSHRREINAWFVVERGGADWKRLKEDGYKRVVAHGSLLWKLLMLNAKHLISSHVDVPIVNPPQLAFAEHEWRFTFLQHGVIKDDLSHWLNNKPIKVFVTSTQAEFESIAGDHTTYPFTSKEVVLTGLPRFDKLREVGLAVPPGERDLILIAPTWRNWLVSNLIPGTQRRHEIGDEIFNSEFMVNWMALLRSEELRHTAERHGVKVAFLPHPVLQPLLPRIGLPDHVVPLTYEGTDVRELFARSAVLVTDYSSVAFNAAYIERPVVYFQFDAERVSEGEHNGSRGYFSYERDGYGPVASTLDDAITAIRSTLDAGRTTQEPYASRIVEAFPLRDGRCCERVTRAILRSAKAEKLGPMIIAGDELG